MRACALAALCVLSLLAGCGRDEAPAPPKPDKQIMVRSASQKALFELNEMNRLIGLKRSIQASGSTCKRATGAHYVGRYKNMDMWSVACDDGRDWALFISADDSVQVRLCKDTEAVGLPSCNGRADWPNGKTPPAADRSADRDSASR